MEKSPVHIAHQRIAHHEAEIARLKAFIETAEALVRESNQVVTPNFLKSTSSVFSPTVTVSTPTTARNEPSPTPTKEVLAAAQGILRERNHSLPAAEIFELLRTAGIKIAGKNPKGNLTAKFATRKEIFTYDKGTGLWSLTEWNQVEKNEAPTEKSMGASKPENKGTEDTELFSQS